MKIALRLIAALSLLVTVPAVAEERITDFVSDVHVDADGTLDVMETISLASEGMEIKRGIQRDFPTRYPGTAGGRVDLGFDVVDVARDGRAEPYEILSLRNGKRVRIGDAGTPLTPGRHVYRIHYRTTRQLGFYRTFDELYWNATGTGWTFPIERAEARITLPAAAPFGKRAVYTGPQGSTGHDAVVLSEEPGRIFFRTTRRLEASEGLTVAVAWPKGLIAEPGALTRVGWALREQGAMLLALAGLLAILLHSARLLWLARRHSGTGPLVPLFSPPDDLSAAALRYIWRMRFDDRTFATAIVDAGVRGRLRIVETSHGSKPGRTVERVDGGAILPDAEEKMVEAMFKSGTSVVLKQTSHLILAGARSALNSELIKTYGEGRCFTEKFRRKLRGTTMIFGLLMPIALILVMTGSSASPLVGLGIAAAIATLFVGVQLLSRARKAIPKKRWVLRILAGAAMVLLCLLLLQFCGAMLIIAALGGNPWPLLPPVIAIPFVIAAWIWLRVPTAEGWHLRGRIAGFRHYLALTEQDRLDRLNPPEKTAALFERYLPYAMAFGVENRWAERFTGVLNAAVIDDTAPNDMGRNHWYVGGTSVSVDPSAFASSIGSTLTSTIASAASAPGSSSSGGSGSSGSSSSGSSGGGSSGGGGGGGGGSGW